MQETVNSAKQETKEELSLIDTDVDTRFRFNINKIVGKRKYKHPELWSLWYSSVFKEIENSLNSFLSCPLDTTDITYNEAISNLERGIEEIIRYAEKNLDKDLTPLIQIRNSITNFKNKGINELTIIISNTGSTGEIEVLDKYIDYLEVNVNLTNCTSKSIDEASLREHRSELFKEFNDYYNRPSNKYKRELYISLKRTEDNTISLSLDVLENRVLPLTFWEKIVKFIS